VLYTSDSKTISETISYPGDFRDVLTSGETLTSYTVTVTVFSGVDPSPSSMLYGGIVVHTGWIEQRICLGLPGVIYEINFEVVTSLGNNYNKVTRLAILPETGNPPYHVSDHYLTTWLYPYNIFDSLKSAIAPVSGNLLFIPKPQDSLKSSLTFLTSTLLQIVILYNDGHDDLKDNITFLTSSLIPVQLYYNYDKDYLKDNIAFISGTLIRVLVSYSIPHDDLKDSITFVSGTLI